MARVNQSDQRGFALLMALLLALAVTAMAIGAILMSSNATLISRFHAKELEMQSAADMGLEVARDTLNGGLALPQTSGAYLTLQTNATVRDASGAVIPGFTRSVYVGETGSTSGQFGVFASVLSVISDTRGAVVVRRAELSQESFAKFARFDDQTTSSIVFANGIQVFGPLHTNGTLYVSATGADPTFWGPVTTASTINSPANGVFRQGYKENQPNIPMPTPANLATLSGYATAGNTVVPGGAVGTSVYDPSVRIEFIPVDINHDGQFTGADEGFMRVYQAIGGTPTAAAKAYVTAREWPTGTTADPNAQSPNCGTIVGGNFRTAMDTNAAGTRLAATQNMLGTSPARRCYLGGDPRLTVNATSNPSGWVAVTPAPANYGQWLPWPGYGAGAAPAAVTNGWLPGGATVGTMDRYLWPVNRPYNPNFKGVVYVNGSVGVSGLVRGQITVASTGNIMLADDITYVSAPGSSVDCSADILGLLTPQYFMLEDNNVNSPFRVNNVYRTGFDDTADEFLHAAVLTLNSIQTEDVSGGSTNSETCVGTAIGRGCFNMVGAAIQGINGSRMTSSGTGWNPQWSYDRCDGIRPPPYFPTTGRFYKNRYYEIDPVGFNVATWFAANAS